MARPTHSSHWGAFTVDVADGEVAAVHPLHDPDPSPLLGNLPGSVRHPSRVAQPVARRGWLEHGPGPAPERGRDSYVTLSWDEALDRTAAELQRVIDQHGNEAVFGGSYGWASAGIFHNAQAQLHRFLNLVGGCTSSVNSYSVGASLVLLPHVFGSAGAVFRKASAWPTIVAHTELLVAFGGLPRKNTFVAPGGQSRHDLRAHLRAAHARGMQIASFSPLRDDVGDEAGARWYPVRPATDTAVMLALAHVLVTEGLHDQDFLDRCCAGADRFIAYVRGEVDGEPKSPEWAEALADIPADDLRSLARRMAASRTLVTVSYSLQRAEHGEQPVWAAVALACLLGQIGLPGGGFGHGYGSMGDVGSPSATVALSLVPQGRNDVRTFIPVARIADLLLCPGAPFDYDGGRYTYPDIRLVHWAGGNPFHHHQDLNRLRHALAQPDTIIVHEPYWTPMARHADIVLPATTSLEREDIGSGRADARIVAMHRVVDPVDGARDDHRILAALAERMGVGPEFTEGRDERAWLEHLYERAAESLRGMGVAAPSFAAFWEQGSLAVPDTDEDRVLFDAFRADPAAHPMRTPSGRIELHSDTVAGFGYADCPGHPTWLTGDEWLGSPRAARFPLALIANNPATRLHSQLDHGACSQASKVQGREPLRMHATDAAARGVADGDVVRVFNDRGACLAGLVVSDAVRPGVVQLSTGAWFDPLDLDRDRDRDGDRIGDEDRTGGGDAEAADREWPTALCVHGNPNVLTKDVGTSSLAQGCSGQHALVEVEAWTGPLPPVRAHVPPPIDRGPSAGRVSTRERV